MSLIPPGARAAGCRRVLVGQPRPGGRRRRGCSRCRPTIVMPSDAPAVKIERTRGHGAEIVLYDRVSDDREAIGGRHRARARRHHRRALRGPPRDRGPGHLPASRSSSRRPSTGPRARRGAGAVRRRWAHRRHRDRGQARLARGRGRSRSSRKGSTTHAARSPRRRPLANAPGARSICDALLASSRVASASRSIRAGSWRAGSRSPTTRCCAAIGFARTRARYRRRTRRRGRARGAARRPVRREGPQRRRGAVGRQRRRDDPAQRCGCSRAAAPASASQVPIRSRRRLWPTFSRSAPAKISPSSLGIPLG